MYHLMVRSYEGWRFKCETSPFYERREVWSTMDVLEDYGEAVRRKHELEAGGVVARVVPQESYGEFCASHTIC